MIVLLDMDDVLDDLLPAWVNWLNEKHGQSVSVEDITQWDMPAAYPELTGEQVYAPLETEEFWQTVLPKEGAVEGVRKLLDEGFDVYVVTSSSYKTLKYKTEHVSVEVFSDAYMEERNRHRPEAAHSRGHSRRRRHTQSN